MSPKWLFLILLLLSSPANYHRFHWIREFVLLFMLVCLYLVHHLWENHLVIGIHFPICFTLHNLLKFFLFCPKGHCFIFFEWQCCIPLNRYMYGYIHIYINVSLTSHLSVSRHLVLFHILVIVSSDYEHSCANRLLSLFFHIFG